MRKKLLDMLHAHTCILLEYDCSGKRVFTFFFEDSLDFRTASAQTIQIATQTTVGQENLYFKSFNQIEPETTRAGSLARLGHLLDVHSNIYIIDLSNVDWLGFRDYMFKKYAQSWARTVYSYARKYVDLVNNPSMAETFSGSKKNSVLKSLIAFSKYCGFYEEFQRKIKAYGIKWSRSSSIDAFLRIMGNPNKDVLEWYSKALEVLSEGSLSTYLKFVLMSGLRKSEAFNAFNLMIDLHEKGKIDDYYNEQVGTLEHFKFPDLFFRNTKNVFISMIPNNMITEITQCNPITYEMIRKRLYRRGLGVRINELRDFYATFMVRHDLIKEEVDLLQGRISKSIFVRHYWSPAIKELKQRVFRALKELEQTTLS